MRALGKLLVVLTTAAIGTLSLAAQDPPKISSPLQNSIDGLEKQTVELKAMMEEMRAEMLRSRAEIAALRQELQSTREQLAAAAPAKESARDAENAASLQKVEEEQQLLTAKVDEQHQTKVESASKYRMRLSGAVMMDLFNNTGSVDNLDVPSLAVETASVYPRGAFGGSLRQSLIGLEAFGPELKGAQVSANVQFDFAGGFPTTADGVTFGLPRLRTGSVQMAWPKTTLVAGQEGPFFSPNSPASVASIAVPALAYSGNLWTWTPQFRAERKFDLTEMSNLLIQGGILDPLTGEPPTSSFRRTPQAGETSRQPAYASRFAWSRNTSTDPITIGVGSYYSRQNWGFARNVDAWAATSDWTVPIRERWELSGEFYRGRALGGLGGGIGHTVLFSGPQSDPRTQVRPVNSIGGWAQAKLRQTPKLEWNAAAGQDNAMARDVAAFSFQPQPYPYASITRNQAAFANFIYRPRSDLLFSGEYRRLRTFSIGGDPEKAGQFSLIMGVLF